MQVSIASCYLTFTEGPILLPVFTTRKKFGKNFYFFEKEVKIENNISVCLVANVLMEIGHSSILGLPWCLRRERICLQ